MRFNELIDLYSGDNQCGRISGILKDTKNAVIQLKGLAGSSRNLLAASVIRSTGGVHLMVMPGYDEAAYLYSDISGLLGSENVLFFPSSFKSSIHYSHIDNGNIILRTHLLNRLNARVKGTDKSNFLAVITYSEGLAEKVISGKDLNQSTLQLSKGEKLSPKFLQEVMQEYDFRQVDFVYEPGQYSARGSIIDIFSYSNPSPYRIDFFGDEVESIRTFDIESQLSVGLFQNITIVPNLKGIDSSRREPLTEYLDDSACIWIDDMGLINDRMNDILQHAASLKPPEGEDFSFSKEDFAATDYFREKALSFKIIETAGSNLKDTSLLTFRTSPQPAFSKNFNLLADDLAKHSEEGYRIFILSDNEKQFERLRSIFEDVNAEINFIPVKGILHEGFADHELMICCYTDHQIFERYHKYAIHNYFSGKAAALTYKELSGLQPGDYVVHIDHGIGIFGGLEKIINNGKVQESIRLVYKDQDVLYVSIHALHRISKYKGKENESPKLNKLGSNSWQKLKQTTKNKIKDIARELITLYAKRKMNDGFAFSSDSYLQTELEASFVYEDTPDQLKTTVAVKEDMEAPMPMDRLVCGDVGFGKTEIAIRAAFKAVADSKQVALLVPTTILALQHYNTFRDRLKEFPCNVEYINRFKQGHQQSEILKKLAEGKTDVIIGTHRLLGADVKFRDLGLLIVDEEQKFGVSAKEKLRNLKANVDTLTLTATPIPRTLQFSLMGIRDLSVINTPPPNRHPIITELHTFNEDIIRSGIEFELSRGGQVFFIHNRVQNINEVGAMLRRICPGISLVIAHGQMQGKELEKNMTDFIRGDYDVLLATAIIESGLDIPNANTIFINNAHHFGLSDLHQLRGRVGRSNRKAFCYLMAPSPALLTNEARRRLKAVEDFSELGSGFNIALQDLDIRGAGNMLGAEQSGFIADVGFDTYNQILNEAIRELQSELPDIKIKDNFRQVQSSFVEDCLIDTDLELLLPAGYVSNVSERMYLYRELDQVQSEEKLEEFEKNLVDRFGPVPDTARELLKIVRLRWTAIKLGFEKIIFKNGKMTGYFISDQKSPYYKSAVFSTILASVQNKPRLFRMKEANNKLTISCEPVRSVQEAIDILNTLSTPPAALS